MEIIMGDYAGIYYANPYDMYGINDRVQDFVPRADGTLKFVESEDGETITRNVLLWTDWPLNVSAGAVFAPAENKRRLEKAPVELDT